MARSKERPTVDGVLWAWYVVRKRSNKMKIGGRNYRIANSGYRLGDVLDGGWGYYMMRFRMWEEIYTLACISVYSLS